MALEGKDLLILRDKINFFMSGRQMMPEAIQFPPCLTLLDLPYSTGSLLMQLTHLVTLIHLSITYLKLLFFFIVCFLAYYWENFAAYWANFPTSS